MTGQQQGQGEQKSPASCVDEVAARRSRRMPQTPSIVDHRTRVDYSSVLELLDDARRLVDDLEDSGEHRGLLFVRHDEIEFVTARLRSLLFVASESLIETERGR